MGRELEFVGEVGGKNKTLTPVAYLTRLAISGKSSLIACLFRMLDLSDGSIMIDGIDISTIPREKVRSRVIAIPQEPYLLNDTVRVNIDPLGLSDDKTIIRALKRVQLWRTVELKGGLNVKMDSEFLSHGQRQLLSLARVLLRRSTILVLDEATSKYVKSTQLNPRNLLTRDSSRLSIDVKVDELMQRVIREEFVDHTIIAVAHRLNTIVDFDKIAVMEKGKLVEFDSPEKLLATPSKFRALYRDYQGEEPR